MKGRLMIDLQERTAERLLRASARHTLDPDTEIDWEQPLLPGAPCMSWRSVSLYGTPLWERMSPQQRVDLSRHEVASLLSTGIWLERVLMQMLLRHTADRDPRSAHVRYALTEIADECRHSVMFGRLLDRLDCPHYPPRRLARVLGDVFAARSAGPEIFAAALIGEEVLDAMQRESMVDEAVQPLLRQVDRLHVAEEARHIGYARDELVRQWEPLGRARRALYRVTIAQTAAVTVGSYLHPGVYPAVGLDAREAVRAVASSPHRKEVLRSAASRLTERFLDLGVIGGPSTRVWRRIGLLA